MHQSVKLTDAIWLLQLVISSPHSCIGWRESSPHWDSNSGPQIERQTTHQLSYPPPPPLVYFKAYQAAQIYFFLCTTFNEILANLQKLILSLWLEDYRDPYTEIHEVVKAPFSYPWGALICQITHPVMITALAMANNDKWKVYQLWVHDKPQPSIHHIYTVTNAYTSNVVGLSSW